MTKRFGWPQLSPIKPYIWDEFNRRLNDFGLDYPSAAGDRLQRLKGPKTTWIRMHSFAQVQINNRAYQGLTISSGFGFDDTYGIAPTRGSRLGVDARGNVLDSSPLEIDRYLPGPGITGVSVSYSGPGGAVRRATINWTCHSLIQLEYLNYFFMSPGTAVMLEYGWSHIPGNIGFDPSDIGQAAQWSPNTSEPTVRGSGVLGAYTNQDVMEDKISAANGNYDVFVGNIVNYSWDSSQREFNCTTEISARSDVMFALQQNARSINAEQPGDAKKKGPQDLRQYISDYVDRIRSGEISGGDKVWKDRNVITVDENQDGDPAIRVEPAQKDFVFITWGMLEDLIEKFVSVETSSGVKLFAINSSDIRISSHPNLISTDGDVLIIPNASAPKYKIDGGLSGERENHKINGIDFHDGGTDRYSGRLYNLFINVDQILKSFNNKQTIQAALYDLLAKMSTAACDIWSFQLRTKTNQPSVLEVVDNNYTGEKTTADFLGNATDDIRRKPRSDLEPVPFLFRVDSSDGIVREFQIETDLTADQVSNIALSRLVRESAKENSPLIIGRQSDVIADLYLGEDPNGIRYMGDLLHKQINKFEEIAESDDKTSEEYDSGNYWKVWVEEQKKYIRYVYPDRSVVNTWLYKDSTNRRNNRNNNILINVKVNLTIDGIAGFRVGDVFMVDRLPRRYRDVGIFQIRNITQQLDGSDWVTQIEGQFRVSNVRPGGGTRPSLDATDVNRIRAGTSQLPGIV